jgi:hypothetical protein
VTPMIRFNGSQYEIDGSRSFNTTTRAFTANPHGGDAFEQQVLGYLNTINSNPEVGSTILSAVHVHHKIGIFPGDGLFSRITSLDAFGRGQHVAGQTQTGTGRGADGSIIFSLERIATIIGAAAQKEAILLHEIVHAIRATWGTESEDPVPGYDDIEEFYSITLSNMYVSSAYPGSSFRGDHSSLRLHLGRITGDPNGLITNPGLAERDLRRFVMGHRTELLRFINELGQLALALSRATCKFNPFRVCVNGWDPAVEEKDRPPQERQPGFGPLR